MTNTAMKIYPLHYGNMAALVQETISYFGDKRAAEFYRDGRWQSLTWDEFGERLLAVCQGLLQLGLKTGDRVGLLAPNSVEWLLVDLAATSIGCITVPIYLTLDEETTQFILDDSDVRVLFADPSAVGEKWLMLQEYFSDKRKKTLSY